MRSQSNKRKEEQGTGSEQSDNSRVARLVAEGALIGLILVCLVVFIALLSFSPDDPGWSTTGTRIGVNNAVGPAGAMIADIFYYLFGVMAYLFPFALALRAAEKLRQHFCSTADEFETSALLLASIGFILIMTSATALAHIQLTNFEVSFQYIGGLLGKEIGDACMAVFNTVGSSLILAALFLFGVSVFADISWFTIGKRVALGFLAAFHRLRDLFLMRLNQRREQQQAQVMKAERRAKLSSGAAEQQKRIAPIIKLPAPTQQKSPRVEREKQQTLFIDHPLTGSLPPLNLLDPASIDAQAGYSPESLEHLSRLLEHKLQDFGISAEVTAVLPGPVVTRFEIQPAAGIKVSRITSLAKDLARSMAVISVRVVEVISGKSVVGIEIPNEKRQMVRLSEVLSSDAYDRANSPLTLALGHDISGLPVVADLARMPHLLVAGTTGSGKSVGINAMLLSLLFKSSAEQVKLILVDPKMLELSVYDGIPHLLTPVITDMNDAASGLRWCVGEMERRYKLMSAMGVRNISGYNRKIEEANKLGTPILDPLWIFDSSHASWDSNLPPPEAPELTALPYIVVVIDEFADMIMIVGKKVEQLIARIAQKARAAGIHLILATQRPSVDVITGLIKANVPTRIAFQVSSKVDSRTILDQGGAEQLLGHGDMLYLPPGTSVPERVHGAFVDDPEVHRVVAELKRRGQPAYIADITDEASVANILVPGFSSEQDSNDNADADVLYDEAVAFVIESRKASISSLQRKLRVGYNRAARLIETMEAAGIVSSMSNSGGREVLVPAAGRP
ncbi:MAG: DNA translocase FtsK 4TM domain-containing protein [Porticoccaceae bacterium]|nr:DNA translocase FtsK 4TM domain-containing protein [Porticoccaceae bacterium]